jgi:hypothetical protein
MCGGPCVSLFPGSVSAAVILAVSTTRGVLRVHAARVASSRAMATNTLAGTASLLAPESSSLRETDRYG